VGCCGGRTEEQIWGLALVQPHTRARVPVGVRGSSGGVARSAEEETGGANQGNGEAGANITAYIRICPVPFGG
jgi:hypothetical protein